MASMRPCLQAVLGAALALLPAVALAEGAAELSRGDPARAVRATDGQTLALDSGALVRLAGLYAPLGDAPYAEDARAGLDALVRGHRVRLRYDAERQDRRDRTLAHVFVEDGAGQEPGWVQGEMLRAGLARVATTAVNTAMAAEMLALEAEARAAGRGLWASPDYAVLEPDPYALAQRLDTFQIVEGIVVSAAETRDFLYLNFGLDYRTDFTVSIAARDIDDIREGGLDPLDLEGARIRVRGYVHAVNGPMIDVDHAAQIELLD